MLDQVNAFLPRDDHTLPHHATSTFSHNPRISKLHARGSLSLSPPTRTNKHPLRYLRRMELAMLSNSSSIPGAAGTSSLTSSIALQACRRPWRPGTRKRWNCSRGRRTAPPWRPGSTTTTRGAGRRRKRRTRCNGRRPPPWRCACPTSPARGGSGGP